VLWGDHWLINMVKRLFHSGSLTSPQLRLPSFDFLLSQQAHPRQLSERVTATLEAVLEKQTELEKRTLELSRQIEALNSNKPSHSEEVCSVSLLMNSLSESHDNFPLRLELDEPLRNPLCKGKYFDLKVGMTGSAALPWAIPIEVLAYTSDSPPQRIIKNMIGGPFFRGERQGILQYDLLSKTWEASFKLQMNEVTSHFRNGWIFLVVQACKSEHSSMIKPLIIEKIVIKAKESTCKRWKSRCSKTA